MCAQEGDATRMTNNLDSDIGDVTLSPSPGQKSFPFLELPPELRIKIYHYVKLECYSDWVLPGVPWLLSTPTDRKYNVRGQTKALLRVNSQIYHEARPLYYRNVHFKFDDLSDLGSFLKMVGPVARANISHVDVSYFILGDTPINEAFVVLALCSNLTNFFVNTASWMLEYAPNMHAKLLDQIEKLDKARRAWGLDETKVLNY
ncbi:MAG: hypothetical protein M1836_003792 [Candelina mexicana]|nr:MAG: hypothetical protein M1836_003792 [Candelina mexicana]